MSAQHQCRLALRTPNSSLWYLYGVSDSEESEGIAAIDLHAWKSCVLPCAPLPRDSLLNRLLMVCQRFSYRTSWKLTFCEARHCCTRYSICLKSNSIRCFLPYRMHGSVSGLKWNSHHWGLHQLTRWRHFLFLLLCDLEFYGFQGLSAWGRNILPGNTVFYLNWSLEAVLWSFWVLCATEAASRKENLSRYIIFTTQFCFRRFSSLQAVAVCLLVLCLLVRLSK